MTAPSVRPERTSQLVHVLFVVQLVSMGAMEMSGPFWPLHLKALSTSTLEFGFAGVAVYVGPMLGIMLTSAFWGRVGDRTGHKLMMIRALVGLSLTQLALAFAQDVWTILALRFVQGACAGYIAPAQTYGVRLVPATRRTRLFAYLQVSTNLGSLVGALGGGVILDHATFFWINASAAALCAACAGAVAVIVPNLASAQSVQSAPAANAAEHGDCAPLPRRTLPISGLLVILGTLLASRTLTQTPFSLYVSSVFQVGNWVVGLCYGLLSFGFVVSASLWARYFENRPRADALQKIARIALACMSLTLVAALTRDIRLFVLLHFVWGVLLAATTPVLMSMISHLAGGTRQGHLLGIAQSVAQFSSIAGIALGGWLSDAARLQYTYFFVATAYAVALVVIVAVTRESARTACSSAAS